MGGCGGCVRGAAGTLPPLLQHRPPSLIDRLNTYKVPTLSTLSSSLQTSLATGLRSARMPPPFAPIRESPSDSVFSISMFPPPRKFSCVSEICVKVDKIQPRKNPVLLCCFSSVFGAPGTFGAIGPKFSKFVFFLRADCGFNP